MTIVLFKSRSNPARSTDDYNETAGRMLRLVSKMPGFVSLDVFNNANGETLIYCQFENDDALKQWRDHAEHKQARGRRDDFYDTYSVQVCEVIREYEWKRDGAA